jgi:hypothetical protein
LGLTFRQDAALDNKWVIEATKPQNFESAYKRYLVEIQVENERGYFTMSVRNLNDNAPLFVLNTAGCENVKVKIY